MLFQERKIETGYHYKVEDVFGTVDIESPTKLTPDLLDDMVVLLLGQKLSAKEVSGSVKHESGEVTYKFVKADMWSEPEEETPPCKNTPTSTNETASESPQVSRWNFPKKIGNTWNWFRRFVEAFREAWKNMHR